MMLLSIISKTRDDAAEDLDWLAGVMLEVCFFCIIQLNRGLMFPWDWLKKGVDHGAISAIYHPKGAVNASGLTALPPGGV